MSFYIKVTDKKSKYFGQVLKGSCVYYDINHTGCSDDLYIAETKDDKQIRLLSSQIDEKYYHDQELEKVVSEIGVNIGDSVIILEGGSGFYKKAWDMKAKHSVTKIDFTGHVTFDDGMATIYRPKLKKIVEDEVL